MLKSHENNIKTDMSNLEAFNNEYLPKLKKLSHVQI